MLYINNTMNMLIATLLILVQSTFIQRFYSKISQKLKLKYDDTFQTFSQQHCGILCGNCDYFYFENKTCYITSYPMKTINNEIYGRYFAHKRIKDKCMRVGSQSYILKANGVCVMIAPVKLNWQDAKLYREAHNGSLMVPETVGAKGGAGLVNFIQTFPPLAGVTIYLGGSDLKQLDQWKWLGGTNISLSDSGWLGGEPNNNKERCVLSYHYAKHKLIDSSCQLREHFVCGFANTFWLWQ